jgi:hypothetical protein
MQGQTSMPCHLATKAKKLASEYKACKKAANEEEKLAEEAAERSACSEVVKKLKDKLQSCPVNPTRVAPPSESFIYPCKYAIHSTPAVPFCPRR